MTEADVDAIDEFEGVVGVSRFAPITEEVGEVDRSELFADVVRLRGVDYQARMVSEECGELLVALSQYLRGRTHALALAEEVADVQVMLDQIPYIVEAARPPIVVGMFRSAVLEFFAGKVGRLESMGEAGRKGAS